ncbi:MAG: hypothetical protein CMH91_15065 [Oceanicaulis sp.]|uniref:hypothetical protein n=1 Tax=Oceanicaulis sp. TaxID=1924941 RepID=UPI000C4F9971|nr:hypothetical protein [Oceanicaulis sp.]MAB70638.1 hypothetical protein [Oceanicaulis sp.]MBC40366.1 hypothetical protein [Oceanicaulis sp.]MBG37342.1 hypothetical protein [Oceanicaulis sp.]HBU62424.1 hypothetical protein [Oceanicaulis sp.]HCR94700.1 hypothetical protein [Oceanicaulis sp.]|tara:strand:+ start:295 stop:660 length:366 start_codon:yes stop_codon:yes gene_type:complete
MSEFVVTRTSCWDLTKAPCEGATAKAMDFIDRRTFKTFEEHDAKLGASAGAWTSKGVDHRVTETGIERRFPLSKSVWVIEVNSLEDLLKLAREEGELVVSASDYGLPEGIPSVEIYDSYRE